jgi:hypothetical protein
VLGGDALVPEVPVDFVDPLDPAHRQPLEVELGRDAQVEIDVQRVVMGHKRPGQRAAGHRLHHRRLDFEETAAVEEAPDAGHHATAHFEHLARLLVDDQIEVALAVADFDILQPMPLLGKGPETLGEKLDADRPDGELVGPGPEDASRHPHEVADIEQREEREIPLRQGILPDVRLDTGAAVCQHQEIGLAEAPDGDDAPAGDGLGTRRLELIVRAGSVGTRQGLNRVGARERPRVDFDPELLDLREVRPALLDQFVVVRHTGLCLALRALPQGRLL